MNTWTLFIQQASTTPPPVLTVRKCEWHKCGRTFDPTVRTMHKRFCSTICRKQSEKEFKKELV